MKGHSEKAGLCLLFDVHSILAIALTPALEPLGVSAQPLTWLGSSLLEAAFVAPLTGVAMPPCSLPGPPATCNWAGYSLSPRVVWLQVILTSGQQ